MSNFSGLTVTEGQKEERRMANGEGVNFKYPVAVADHYKYRGAVDNHNILRHYSRTSPKLVWRVHEEPPGGPS